MTDDGNTGHQGSAYAPVEPAATRLDVKERQVQPGISLAGAEWVECRQAA